MSDFEWDPAPIDSDDLYAMGLRAPSCNGCEYAKKKWELGDRFLRVNTLRGVGVYEIGAQPTKGQGEPYTVKLPPDYEKQPIRFHAWYMSIGHSDECYNWTPPREVS